MDHGQVPSGLRARGHRRRQDVNRPSMGTHMNIDVTQASGVAVVVPRGDLDRAAVPTVRSAEPRGKILVVDDEVAVAEVLTDYLTEQGYQVAMAHNGVEALAKMDQEQPLAVLLDIRMQGM